METFKQKKVIGSFKGVCGSSEGLWIWAVERAVWVAYMEWKLDCSGSNEKSEKKQWE